ncbi:MAG: HU family DNA-binding protein [Bacteroidaceae bacterium]|jgi:predicted histone-like DNA-binding protein|nr:HU family DNA-binding protein [Bacteroidaceae bacterium]
MALIYEVRKQVLGFKEDKPTVYKVAAVRQQKVDFAKLVKEVSDSCGVHRTQSKAVVEALIDRLIHYMDFGMAVQLAEFGTFKPVIRTKAKKTAEEVSVDNIVTRAIRFYPSKRMKEMLENLTIQTFERNDDADDNDAVGGGDDTSGGTDSGGATGGNPL